MNAHLQAPIATIRLFSDGLSPQHLTGLIAITPDAAAAKGDVLVNTPGRRPVTAPTGTWYLTTKNRHLGSRPEKHLEWIMDKANQVIGPLRRRVPDIQVDLSLLVHDPNFAPRHLPHRLLEDATSLGDLEIEVPEAGGDWILTRANVGSHIGA